MSGKKALVGRAGAYLAKNPDELLRALKNVVDKRVGVPIDVLRFFAGQIKGKRAPRDVEIEAVPPGIRFAATIDVMKTSLRAGATLTIEDVRINEAEARFELRVTNVALDVLGDADSPVAALIKSGSLDLSRPGTLISYLPKRSPALVEAEDDRFVVDLMREPKLALRGAKIVRLVAPVLSVRSIETDPDHLDVYVTWFPAGLAAALESFRSHL